MSGYDITHMGVLLTGFWNERRDPEESEEASETGLLHFSDAEVFQAS